MKRYLLLLTTLAMVAISASATKIYVCGTKITGTTNFNAGGGTVSYNDNTRTLNINNVSYTKTGSSNNGISVDEVPGELTINMTGTVKFDIGNADAVLCKSGKTTYINISGTATFLTKSSGHAALKLQDGDVTVSGSGDLTLTHTSSGSNAADSHAVKGGEGTENLTMAIKHCTLESPKARLYNLNKVTINPTGNFGSLDYSTWITFKKSSTNTSHAQDVNYWSAGTAVKIFKPKYNVTINYLSSSYYASSDVSVNDITAVAFIDAEYFPDANFRNYLLNNGYSKGYITSNDVANRTTFSLSSKSISNLQGIEYFTQITSLYCSSNNLTSLNVSALTKLTTLDCHSNQLTSLGTLPSSLQTLNCSSNRFSGTFQLTYRSALKDVDLSSNTNVGTVQIYGNSALTSLNVTNCSSMTYLECNSNNISSLSLSGCSALQSLYCQYNQLTSLTNIPNSVQNLYANNNKFSGTFQLTNRSALKTLDISNNASLTTLNCYSNALTSLNVNGCTALTTLDCHGNQLTSLSNLPTSLQTLNCSNNQLTGTLSLSSCSALTTLYCNNNQLTSLTNIPNSVQNLYANNNKLSGTFNLSSIGALKTLDVNNNPYITALNVCYNSALTTLNLNNCSAMTTLYCYSNQLSSLDLTGCTKINYINCQNNKLTSLNLSPCSSTLQYLYCHYNQLTSLDVSSLSNLTEFNCSWNKLSTLIVSNKTKLTQLQAHYNQLTSLNVHGCSLLNYLMLESNKLSSLSVQGCNSLRTINCCLNQINASGATTLINSLCSIPAGSQGSLRYIYPGYSSGSYQESNDILNDTQVRAARNKSWIPYKFVAGTGWVEIPVSSAVPGDVNGDESCTSSDVTALYNYLLYNDDSAIVNGDQNGDGTITSSDVTAVYNIILFSGGTSQSDETEFTVNGVNFKMIRVNGGTFMMGASDSDNEALDNERPAHQVTLSSYYIGQTEVTQELWQAVMGENPSYFVEQEIFVDWGRYIIYYDNIQRPVEQVTWDECQEFVAALSQMTGKNFRLPTEAEWEFAARGGNKSQGYKYAGSNDIDAVAWYGGVEENWSLCRPATTPETVASMLPNELGLYDMSGNVWEWCQDWYGSYSAEAQTNPTGPASGSKHVFRGGAVNEDPIRCRVSKRSYNAGWDGYSKYVGLRIVMSAE